MNPLVVLSDDEVVALMAARGWQTRSILFSVPTDAAAAADAAQRGERTLGARTATDERIRPAIGEIEERLRGDRAVVLFVEDAEGAVGVGLHVVHYLTDRDVLAEWVTGDGVHRFDLLEPADAWTYFAAVVRAVAAGGGTDDQTLRDGHRLRVGVRTGPESVQTWSLAAGSAKRHAEPDDMGVETPVEDVLAALRTSYPS